MSSRYRQETMHSPVASREAELDVVSPSTESRGATNSRRRGRLSDRVKFVRGRTRPVSSSEKIRVSVGTSHSQSIDDDEKSAASASRALSPSGSNFSRGDMSFASVSTEQTTPAKDRSREERVDDEDIAAEFDELQDEEKELVAHKRDSFLAGKDERATLSVTPPNEEPHFLNFDTPTSPAPTIASNTTSRTTTSVVTSKTTTSAITVPTGSKSSIHNRPAKMLSITTVSPRPARSPSPARRERVPGGAAAKLMLIGPKKSNSQSDDDAEIKERDSQESKDSSNNEENVEEIDQIMKKTKEEFSKGSEGNRRYHNLPPTSPRNKIDRKGTMERISTTGSGLETAPSFLNRSEIFHETATAAIAAILAPRDRAINDSFSMASAHSEAGRSMMSSPNVHSPMSVDSHGDNNGYDAPHKTAVTQNLLSREAEHKLEDLKSRMLDPTPTITDLLTAIATPESKSKMDLGFMVRRKNACGALQVLTVNAAKRGRICWTIGVLPALTSVLSDVSEEGLHASFPDRRIRKEYLQARDRAILALVNLSAPKQNRIAVFHCQELVQSVVATILEDNGTARKGCCTILAYLAKSPDNRLLMVQVPGFLEAVVRVLTPISTESEAASPLSKKPHPWSSGDTSDSESEAPVRNEESFVSESTVSHDESWGDEKEREEEKDQLTPRSQDTLEVTGYDETADAHLREARQSVFALLSHLGKEKDNAYHLARDISFVTTLVAISTFQDSPSHVQAVKTIANMTRHRSNTKVLVFKHRTVVPAIVAVTASETAEAREYACYTLQNMAQDKSCRQELAITNQLISALCRRARHAVETNEANERLASISALKNLCDEPANLIPLTNTPECIATLMHLAHGAEANVSETMQYRACDALATLSHWLRKIATSGQALNVSKSGSPKRAPKPFVPSLRMVTWNQWQ